MYFIFDWLPNCNLVDNLGNNSGRDMYHHSTRLPNYTLVYKSVFDSNRDGVICYHGHRTTNSLANSVFNSDIDGAICHLCCRTTNWCLVRYITRSDNQSTLFTNSVRVWYQFGNIGNKVQRVQLDSLRFFFVCLLDWLSWLRNFGKFLGCICLFIQSFNDKAFCGCWFGLSRVWLMK